MLDTVSIRAPRKSARFRYVKTRLKSLKVPKLRLYQQIIICFVLAMLIPLLGVSLIIYNINQKALKKELARFTEHTAEAIYKDLHTEMSWQQNEIRMLGTFLIDRYKNGRGMDKAAAEIFELSGDYETIGLYDEDGKVLGKAYRNFFQVSPERRVPEELTIVPDPVATYHVLFSDSADPQESDYYLRAIIPVNHPPVRYYLMQKKFPYLQELIRVNRHRMHDGVFVINDAGRIIAGPTQTVAGRQHISTEDYRFFQGIPVGVTREFSTPVQTANPSAALSDDNDEAPPLQKVFVKMPNINWGLIIESPYHVRQRYIKRARNQTLFLIVGCMAIVILGALGYILGISRNFRQLLKATRAMAEGKYSRRIRLITNVTTPYEIVYLAGEFNRMGKKVADAWEQSQTLTQELIRKNDQEAFLNRVTNALHGSLELEDVSRVTVRELGLWFDAEVSALSLAAYESGDGGICPLVNENNPFWLWQSGLRVVLDRQRLIGFSDWQWLTPGAAEYRLFGAEESPWLQTVGLGAALGCPIVFQDQLLGFVLLMRQADKPVFTEDEGYLLGLVAKQIGVATHQAQQWETIQDANRKLAKLDEMKSNLIDTVSHELRTPLTNIKGYTSRLLRYDAALDTETRTKSLKVIKQQADRLGRLVDDLLVIPDIERETLRFFLDQVELPELIERSVQFIQEKEHREIRVSLPAHAESISVLSDPDRLEQILLNLLDNAVKYSYPDTPIDVVAEFTPDQQYIGLTVANACDYIPPEALSTLFEKFKRLDESTTRTTRGSGLGLYITKGLVEAMGGRIGLDYAESKFKISVCLPLYNDVSDLKAPPAAI
jgi:signal transduction histidine kinase/HAMP domain-containing protein